MRAPNPNDYYKWEMRLTATEDVDGGGLRTDGEQVSDEDYGNVGDAQPGEWTDYIRLEPKKVFPWDDSTTTAYATIDNTRMNDDATAKINDACH